MRAEPLVLTVPAIEKDRYYSLQFVDMYTFNFAYVGSRATGNGAGKYLLAGPGWKGPIPPGIKAVIRSETSFAFVLYRTQLFDAADIHNVKKVQDGYRVEPLSWFLGKPTPAAPLPSSGLSHVKCACRPRLTVSARRCRFWMEIMPSCPEPVRFGTGFARIR